MLIGWLLTVPRDVATSEVSSRSLVILSLNEKDMWRAGINVELLDLNNKIKQSPNPHVQLLHHTS